MGDLYFSVSKVKNSTVNLDRVFKFVARTSACQFQIKFSRSKITSIPSCCELRVRHRDRGSPQLRLISEPRGHRCATDANENGCHDEPGKGRRATVLADIIITGMFELALTFTDTFPRAYSRSRIAINVQRELRRVAPFS